MKINLIVVGKLKEKFLVDGVAEYLKKGRFVTVMGTLKVAVVSKDNKTFVNLDVWVQNLDLAPVAKES